MISKRLYIFIGSLLFLLVSGLSFIYFINYHEAKVDNMGWIISDPLFQYLPIGDVSIYIFSITYGALLIYVITQFKTFLFVERFMVAYGLLLLIRIITLTLFPLKEPEALVFLEDPFLNNLIYPGNIDSDLFFSGHTSLMFILFFLTKKWWFAILGLILAFLLLVQRVHYTVDVLAAISFSFFIVKIVELVFRKLNKTN